MRGQRKREPNYTRIIGAIMVLLMVIGGIIYACTGNENSDGEDTGKTAINANASKLTHIMIMGVDQRQDDCGRSDTLMVAQVDKDKENATLLSVPRDTRVKIEGHGYDKINHAYAFGGEKLTQSTLENVLGIDMDYYIMIDTKAFERVINILDGIDIDVEKRMYYEDPWDDNGGLVIDLFPGMQHLDGARAIQYVRYRDGEGDIGRINRQQHFMRAVLEKVMTPQILPKLPEIVKEIRSSVETNMPLEEMLSLITILPEIKAKGLSSEMLPGCPAYLDDVSYWLPDILGVRKIVAAQVGKELAGDALKNAELAKKAYEDSLPKNITVVAENNDKSKDKNSDKEKSNTEKDSKSDSTKKDGSNSEAAKKAATKADSTGDISVLVVNDSGINGAAAKVAAVLQSKGFIITGVETGKRSDRANTIIVTDSSNVNWFYGMPFECIIMDGGQPRQAIVYIGRDYND